MLVIYQSAGLLEYPLSYIPIYWNILISWVPGGYPVVPWNKKLAHPLSYKGLQVLQQWNTVPLDEIPVGRVFPVTVPVLGESRTVLLVFLRQDRDFGTIVTPGNSSESRTVIPREQCNSLLLQVLSLIVTLTVRHFVSDYIINSSRGKRW